MALRPMERSTNERPMNDAQRRHHHGPIRPMEEPGLLARLLSKVLR